MKRTICLTVTLCLISLVAWGQTSFSKPTRLYLMHSSGNHLEKGGDQGGWIESPTKASPQQMTIIPDGKGYYNIQAGDEQAFLAFASPWNSTFVTDATVDEALFTIEQASSQFVKLRCKSNGKYLGTDSNNAHSRVYTDKSGSDVKHHWYFSTDPDALPPTDTVRYVVNPLVVRQHFEGWGVSLCWWASQCGKWTDQKIDEIVTWLVSPTGLNYSRFRYNIGGGDDPLNRNCDLHHMGQGKGLRAEMEGFKDSTNDVYHWDRDAAQRKIMLKIREKRPDAVFEAFSNSCPYYMTYSGCVSGNTSGGKDNLRPECYEEFAHYLVDVCKHYKEEYGIEFRTLEPFNESATSYWSANGGQEGCHFDYDSQIRFLRVLAPVLAESGLGTTISAADETNVAQAVDGVKRYISNGIDGLVGQWNTHTYSGSNVDRARLAQLAHQTGKPLWMSETGEGGSGIGGNLALAQRLMDDMRYLQPEAWVDWQYMEEGNDQWCTVRGNFANQTYQRVKNYYVRQQCSRFIPGGYDIITSPCPQTLAAVNAQRDTLVLVVLNEGTQSTHCIDLSLFSEQPVRSSIRAYRTSSSENVASALASVEVAGNVVVLDMPAQSITTLVVPIRSASVAPEELLADGQQYLIVPRQETRRAVTATSASAKVTLEDIDYGDAQRWTLTETGDGTYSLRNALGLFLTAHRASASSSLTAEADELAEQTFYIDEVDYPYFKVLASLGRSHGLDLTSASSSAGTTVGIWQYDESSNTTPTHRQWMFFPLAKQGADGIEPVRASQGMAHDDAGAVYDLSGRRIVTGKLSKGIYIVNGKKVMIPLKKK